MARGMLFESRGRMWRRLESQKEKSGKRRGDQMLTGGPLTEEIGED